jgi:tRNA dimethylallyltransferase
MNKLLVICGPTATGKTNLGIRLAKELSGEIISADSRQVYRGMDIGTGKEISRAVWRPVRKGKEREAEGYWEIEGVPVHLLDVVEPNQEFSLAHFYRLAWREIKNLWQKGKLPILVGGTGLYLKGVVDGIETREIPRQPQLRAKLEDWSTEKLFNYLAQIDFEKAGSLNQSDRKNPRRLVRAIEVAFYRQENPFWQASEHQESDALFFGLTAPLEILDKKIEMRVKARLKQGLEAEIRGLLAKGFTWEKSALGDTLAYQEWQPFFEGRVTREEVISRWQTDERQYARRQMTWFKKNKQIHWFDISQKGWQNEIEDLVNEWFSKKDDQ